MKTKISGSSLLPAGALLLVLLLMVDRVNGQSYGDNLIVGGDFEAPAVSFPLTTLTANTDYLVGTWYRNTDRVIKETTHPINGIVSVQFNISTTNGGAVDQRIDVEANTVYRLTLTARVQDEAGSSGAYPNSNNRTINANVKGGKYWITSNSNIATTISISENTNTTKSVEFNTGSNTSITIRINLPSSNPIAKGYLDDVILVKKLASIATASSNPLMGTVTESTVVNWGPNTSVSAIPAPGYHFVNWTEQDVIVSTEATYNFAATADRNLVANFAPNSTIDISSGITQVSSLDDCATCDLTVASGAELNIDANKTLNSVTIAAGGKITLNSDYVLTTTGGIKLQNSSTHSASFLDSRTDDNPSAVGGLIEQTISASKRNWYVAVPVSGRSASDITLSGSYVVQRNEENASWDNVTGALTAGVGYIAVASANEGAVTWSLSGNFSSGKIEVPVTRSGASSTGFNLLGNPYPSYLNWEQVLNLNAANASLLQPSIWYRTANYNNDLQKFEYTFNTYNSAGRVATPTGTSGYIPPMQAFWVRVNSAGTVTFNNAMRSHGDGATNSLKSPKVNEQRILRLQIANAANSTDETVVYFDENAQNAYDKYDTQKMFNKVASQPEIFTKSDNEHLVINGMHHIPFNISIPLGVVIGEPGEYRLMLTEFSNFEPDTRIMLNDKLDPSAEIELSAGISYSFSSELTTPSSDRFSLTFRAPGITTSDTSTVDNLVRVYVNAANQICIDAPENSHYAIYNAVGQKINENIVDSTRTDQILTVVSGLYIVKISRNNHAASHKVIIR